MAQAAASASRRGSGFCLNQLQNLPGYGPTHRSASSYIVQNKSNSLSLPDSPTVAGQTRGRSNSLRVSLVFFSVFHTISIHLYIYQDIQYSIRLKAILCCGAQVHCVKVYQMLGYQLVGASLHLKRLALVTLPH